MENETRSSRAAVRRVCEPGGMGADFSRRRFAPHCFCVLGILLIVLSCFAYPLCAEAQSADWGLMATRSKEYKSSDVPRDIPGKGTETSTLTIADAGPIVDLNVKLNITHPYDADLDVFLIAPDGTRVELFTDVGGDSANFEDTILDDEAPESITDGTGPFAGSYRPEGRLADFKTKDLAGTWTLEVTDDWSISRAGTLNSWSLIVELEAKEPLPAPVIHVEQSVPGGIYDTVRWEDAAAAKEYASSVAVPIPDQGTATSSLAIEDFGMIEDLNVKLDITHPLDSDMDVFLIAPDKTRIELFTDVGGLGDNFTDTVLDDDAALSITEGSAPFTGTYRPEGKLSDLVGKDVHGTWTLEVTDDSMLSSGTLNHWSVTVDVADTLYYAECATDAEFSTVVANSGWIAAKSYTFADLVPDQQYWYRVKVRPMETWLQTSQSDFAADTLTGTETTSDGDVTLAGGDSGGLGPEVFAIRSPSFESSSGWLGASNDPLLAVTGLGIWRGLWASDGIWAGGVLFGSDFTFSRGTYAYLLQQNIDWTGVGTLMFDYCSFYGSDMTSQVLIGDQEVWSHTHTDRWAVDHYDIAVDVSGITGRKDLKLRVEVTGLSLTNAAALWDNLRTYGPTGHEPSGTVVSSLISIGEGDTWDLLRFNATTPGGTTLTADVLPASGSMPIDPWRQIPSSQDGLAGIGLSGLADRNIRLRANLSTSNPSITPALHDWSVTYSDATRQSAWSNVESSLPPK
jgi:subtilisin-like proprotein convertase family protein